MKRIAIVFASFAFCLPLFAQNINQSVQVTNEYEAKFADFQKQGIEMTVPDSLYSFDYDFDYSVFDTPYLGSYEFTPYLIKVTPSAMPYDGKNFSLRAGLGYSIHPLFDLSFIPVLKDNFALSLYNTASGYYGKYQSRGLASAFNGHDLSDNFGINGHLIGVKNVLTFNVGYDGLYVGDATSTSGLHSGYLRGNLKSAASSDNIITYELGLEYRYSGDVFSGVLGNIGEHLFSFGGSIGTAQQGNKTDFILDFDFSLGMLNDGRNNTQTSNSLAGFTPHLSFVVGPFDVDAGVRLNYGIKANSGTFSFAPILKFGLPMFGGTTKAFAGLSGGKYLNSYYSLKFGNHFYSMPFAYSTTSGDKLNVFLGFDGHIGSSFHYNMKGGYALKSNAPLDFIRSYCFHDYNLAYADLEAEWDSERLSIDACLNYSYAFAPENIMAFLPAAFSGDIRLSYNWINRIYAGLSVNGATNRRDLSGTVGDINGFVDLGLFGEYKINSKWSVWARGGNLAGMKIERTPGFIEKGPYFTAGFGLNL